jgi:Zn-dependent protease
VGLPELNLTVQALVFRVLALLIIVAVQGVLVAGLAVLLGDKGPKHDGRLTVSPARHIDLVGAFSLVLFGNGWAKPVDVDAREFGTGRAGLVLVVLGTFAGLLTLAALLHWLVLPAVTALPHTGALSMAAFLREASSLTLALLSLVPVPPLTGGLLLSAVGVRVPKAALPALALVVAAAVAMGAVRELFGAVHAFLSGILLDW